MSGFTGRKERVGGQTGLLVKTGGLTQTSTETVWLESGRGEEFCVAVKCADIRKNTNGEGSSLGRY